jgi:hypothetical protein
LATQLLELFLLFFLWWTVPARLLPKPLPAWLLPLRRRQQLPA